MNPGRELDALVAEKVMGWGKDYLRVDWSPSTDIAAAWEVMEQPHFDGWVIGRNANGEWEFFNPWADNTIVSVSHTAPHAICLAALKAIGVEV